MNYPYAQIDLATRIVGAVSELHSVCEDEHMVPIQEYDPTLIGKRHNLQTREFEAVAPAPVPQRCTKRAFKKRFPKMANNVSTKWDAMVLFLTDDSYAASLGVTGSAVFDLRMLITTGVELMDASPFVLMGVGEDAANMTLLLTNASIPTAFRLTGAERTAMLDTPLTDAERYVG